MESGRCQNLPLERNVKMCKTFRGWLLRKILKWVSLNDNTGNIYLIIHKIFTEIGIDHFNLYVTEYNKHYDSVDWKKW